MKPQTGRKVLPPQKAVKKPVTVVPQGFNDTKDVNAVEFAKMAEGSGVAVAVAVHGRTREQYYSESKADWGY